MTAIVSEIYFIMASEGGTIIFQSSNRLENSAGYREWSSILSDRKLSPILYGGIFQNYHDWTQTANSNANIICNPARALRALGLLLADSALTVGRGKTF